MYDAVDFIDNSKYRSSMNKILIPSNKLIVAH